MPGRGDLKYARNSRGTACRAPTALLCPTRQETVSAIDVAEAAQNEARVNFEKVLVYYIRYKPSMLRLYGYMIKP